MTSPGSREIFVASDIGGTFADTVVLGGTRRLSRYKSPTAPDDLVRGVLDGHVTEATALKSTGVVLGPLGENWRALAPWRRMTAQELGPRIRVDERLEVRQYVDPQTGRSLWVDVVRTGDRLPWDFVLKA